MVARFLSHNAFRWVTPSNLASSSMFSSTKMGKTKEANDSKRKRKRVAVESSSDDDESEQDLEEVNNNFADI